MRNLQLNTADISGGGKHCTGKQNTYKQLRYDVNYLKTTFNIQIVNVGKISVMRDAKKIQDFLD